MPERSELLSYRKPADWKAFTRAELATADRARANSELVRADLMTLCHDACERTAKSQADVTRRLGDRANDVKFWRDEVRAEADAATAEAGLLNKATGCLERAIIDTEEPLHIATECLRLREQRIGVDLISDEVEKELIREVNLIKQCQEEMKELLKDAKNLAVRNQSSQNELAKEAAEKHAALGMDRSSHRLRNTSRGLQFYDGIEEFDSTVSNPESWTQHNTDVIEKSQRDRGASKDCRSLIEQMLANTAAAMVNQWTIVNAAFADRIREYIKARTDLEVHLAKVLQEIVELEKYGEMLKKCIRDKEAPLKLAQTRLATRVPRQNMESCKDSAHNKLVEEVHEIGETVEQLKAKLRDVDGALLQLQQTRASLEQDLAVKNNSIHIDRELCLSWRKSFDMSPRRTVCY
jgi:tektin-3